MRLAAALLVTAALAVAGCGGGNDEEPAAGTTVVAQTDTVPSAPGCTRVAAPEARENGGRSAPKEALDPSRSYALVFRTNCGSFTVTLDQATAPKTAASLVALARDGYFDGTIFHRIVPGFVVQGGDPTQSGSGGPGYQTVDVPPPGTTYSYGTVAMAKTTTEPPGTAGSQFFVVTAPDAGLPPEYAMVGKVTKGLATIDRIGNLGNADERPTQTVLVERVTVSES